MSNKQWIMVSFPIFMMMTPFVSSKTDYCKFSLQHILCGGEKDFGPNCGDRTKIELEKASEEQKVEILNAHNSFRNNVAGGKETRAIGGALPKAANMEEMVWDDELAKLSEEHVKNCIFQHSCDGCQTCERFQVGENLYYGTYFDRKSLLQERSWNAIVEGWTAGELTFYVNSDTQSFLSNPNSAGFAYGKYGHLTQAIWASTRFVGCARIHYKHRSMGMVVYASCHYGPTGNTISNKVYELGEPCSKCPNNETCSSEFPNLCASKGKRGATSSNAASKGKTGGTSSNAG